MLLVVVDRMQGSGYSLQYAVAVVVVVEAAASIHGMIHWIQMDFVVFVDDRYARKWKKEEEEEVQWLL